MRLAARPVGAQSESLIPFAESMRRMSLTMVVLPTPGPPVMTSTLEISASRIALIGFPQATAPRLRNPLQRLVCVDPRPRQYAFGKPHELLVIRAFRSIKKWKRISVLADN